MPKYDIDNSGKTLKEYRGDFINHLNDYYIKQETVLELVGSKDSKLSKEWGKNEWGAIYKVTQAIGERHAAKQVLEYLHNNKELSHEELVSFIISKAEDDLCVIEGDPQGVMFDIGLSESKGKSMEDKFLLMKAGSCHGYFSIMNILNEVSNTVNRIWTSKIQSILQSTTQPNKVYGLEKYYVVGSLSFKHLLHCLDCMEDTFSIETKEFKDKVQNLYNEYQKNYASLVKEDFNDMITDYLDKYSNI